jgi:hypothetical protein
MNKPASKITAVKAKAGSAPTRKPRTTSKKQAHKTEVFGLKHRLLMLSTEAICLMLVAVYAIMVFLGNSANWLSGTSLVNNLLPFAGSVLALVLAATVVIICWWKLRNALYRRFPVFSPILPISFVILVGWFGLHTEFSRAVSHFRTLVGGKHEVSRVTLAHQVYAAYRRYDNGMLQQMVERSKPFNPAIIEAAKAFSLDVNLLQGIAATESSFLPRDSFDGGHGLFQITLVPKHIMASAAKRLDVDKPDLNNARHNAYIAAATFKFYLQQMKNDLFLGLLAYNIGPTNGGLRFIMQQYGVTDFITIQPYLQQLPRDYPIRVLSYALAFRLWQKEGRLPAYEEGENAIRIQEIGVPGLQRDM